MRRPFSHSGKQPALVFEELEERKGSERSVLSAGRRIPRLWYASLTFAHVVSYLAWCVYILISLALVIEIFDVLKLNPRRQIRGMGKARRRAFYTDKRGTSGGLTTTEGCA